MKSFLIVLTLLIGAFSSSSSLASSHSSFNYYLPSIYFLKTLFERGSYVSITEPEVFDSHAPVCDRVNLYLFNNPGSIIEQIKTPSLIKARASADNNPHNQNSNTPSQDRSSFTSSSSDYRTPGALFSGIFGGRRDDDDDGSEKRPPKKADSTPESTNHVIDKNLDVHIYTQAIIRLLKDCNTIENITDNDRYTIEAIIGFSLQGVSVSDLLEIVHIQLEFFEQYQLEQLYAELKNIASRSNQIAQHADNTQQPDPIESTTENIPDWLRQIGEVITERHVTLQQIMERLNGRPISSFTQDELVQIVINLMAENMTPEERESDSIMDESDQKMVVDAPLTMPGLINWMQPIDVNNTLPQPLTITPRKSCVREVFVNKQKVKIALTEKHWSETCTIDEISDALIVAGFQLHKDAVIALIEAVTANHMEGVLTQTLLISRITELLR